MKSENTSKGLVACEEALQRLLDGVPIVSQHVKLDISKLTASIVSFEAGFDRGYLKKIENSICRFWQRSMHLVQRLTKVPVRPTLN